MLVVFVALVIGVMLGASGLLPAWARHGASVVTMAGLVVLLCAMGASIGADEQLMRNVGEIGLQAGALAGSATLGSVVAGWGWERLVGRRQETDQQISKAANQQISKSQIKNRQSPISEGQEAGGGKSGSTVWLTVLIVGAVLAGVTVGALKLLPSEFVAWLAPVTSAALGVLLFGIGIEIGYNRRAWSELRRLGPRVLGLPLSVAAGSIVGALGAGWALGLPLNQASAIGAGFGWYSLSGVLLAQLAGASVGALAFLANVLRELLAVLTMPFLARYLGRAAAVAAGGATSMDSTLPVVVRAAGDEAALLAFTSGAVLTGLVPVLVPLLIRL
jgi:uncharacterized membrane protein YbjE (DUF340 family)